jgi:hypothetical protein
MPEITDEILAAEREHSLGVQLLTAAERDQLRERIVSKYGGRSDRIWETAEECTALQDSEGWRWIREFIGPRSCVLLFDLSEEVEMFQVPSGASLDQLLHNTFGFEFYVTDLDCTYLIGFNHHDVLVCCGSAEEWLQGRLTES